VLNTGTAQLKAVTGYANVPPQVKPQGLRARDP
jgi:hypothetical protein